MGEEGSWTTSLARSRVTLGCILGCARTRSMHVDRAELGVISDPGARRVAKDENGEEDASRYILVRSRERIVDGQVLDDVLIFISIGSLAKFKEQRYTRRGLPRRRSFALLEGGYGRVGVETDSSITGWARIMHVARSNRMPWASRRQLCAGLSNLHRNRWRNIHRPTSRACLPRLSFSLSLSLSIFNSLNDG